MPKHKSYTVTFKLSAIKWYNENGKSIKRTAKEFAVDRKRIREWLQKEEDLVANSHGKEANKRRLSYGADIISEEVESGVLEYLMDERERGLPVSNKDLQEKALEIARECQDPQGRLGNFKASDGWLTRWKKRNRVAILRGTSEAQKVPEDYGPKIQDYVALVKAKRRLHHYTLYNIGNMDQTMCRFDMAPKSTNNLQNERSVRIATTGGSKRGFTVALCALASGHKKPAYICFKENNGVIPPRVLANLRVPANVLTTASHNGWMTGVKMGHWINRIWGPNRDDVRRLLVLDMARIHTMELTKEQLEDRQTDVVYIPGGCTPICQPADVCWNAPFKSALRAEWSAWLREDRRTPQGNLHMASRQEVINWVSRAWNKVSEETIKKSFKCVGLDDSDCHLMTDNMLDALNAGDGHVEDIREEALALLFESDSDSEWDFEGFSDSDI